ncbi:MAG: diguanylate cyclase [Pseudomonadales bacterium]
MLKVTTLLILILSLALSACEALAEDYAPNTATSGVVDLSQWDPEKDGPVALAGEWEFYWNALLSPSEIDARQSSKYTVAVPGKWTKYTIDELGELGPEGYATFRLTVVLPDGRQILAIPLVNQGSAFSLWIDGRLAGEVGKVGTSKETMKADKWPSTAYFQTDNKTAEFVVQISNFHHRKAGFRNALRLGAPEDIKNEHLQSWFTGSFVAGILFIMGMYHIFLFAYRREEKAALYFGLGCFSLAIRQGLIDPNIANFIFPNLDWSLGLRIEYIMLFIAAPVYVLFLSSLYPKDIPLWLRRVTVAVSLILSGLTVSTNTISLSHVIPAYQIFLGLWLISIVYILHRLLRREREGAKYIVFASGILAIGMILEIAHLANLVDAGNSFIYAFLVFLFVQAIMLSSQFSRSFSNIKALSTDLESSNIHLKESESKYRKLFNESRDIIFIMGTDECAEDVNPACEHILGYTAEELRAKPIMDLVVDPSERDRFLAQLSVDGFINDFETRLRRKNGEIFPAQVTANVRFDDNGDLCGMQGNMRDITARKQAEYEAARASKLEIAAVTDALTKIYNRGFFNQAIADETTHVVRAGSPLSLILLDIDHFKDVNDSHGHTAGDQALIEIASLCQKELRSVDIFARYGGEEFAILMPKVEAKMAFATAERLRKLVQQHRVILPSGTQIALTMSTGVSCMQDDETLDAGQLINQADSALYQSKRNGRNRSSIWSSDSR